MEANATHLTATLPPDDSVGDFAELGGLLCEIQVCSLMASAWNELEHEVRYKHAVADTSREECDLLCRLGDWVQTGDELVAQLLAATAARQRARTGEFEDVHDFVARMEPHVPGVDIALHAGPLFDALSEFGLANPRALARAIFGANASCRSGEIFRCHRDFAFSATPPSTGSATSCLRCKTCARAACGAGSAPRPA